jgi:predicted amidophosphoribosyltransferase
VGGLHAFAPLAYEGPVRDLVRALKYRGAQALATTMAAQIAANAPPGMLRGADAGAPIAVPGGFDREAPVAVPGQTGTGARPPPVLVPVPLDPARRRRRGFNQAGLLAATLAERAGLEVADCLERRGGRGTQVGRGRAERIAGPVDDVRLRRGARAPPRAVLVDDVITTGATLSACARSLRAAGCLHVVALAYARTLAR